MNNSISEKQGNLQSIIKRVEEQSAANSDVRRAVGTLTEDLTYVSTALDRDPELWRLNRSFHIVHVPSFIAVLSFLGEIDQMRSLSDEDAHQMLSSLNRASSLAIEARQRIEQVKLSEAKVELDVLSEYAPAPSETYREASLVARTVDNVSALSDTIWKGAKSGAAQAPSLLGSLQNGASSTLFRAASLPKLAANFQKSVSGTLSDTVTKPISMRLDASGRALKHGWGTGVGLGVVAGVLCPPLLPVTAGGAVLVAMRTWRKEMDKASALNDAEREQREAELRAERAAALQQLAQGAAALQMENDELNITLDVETGEADAVILKGEHTGSTWSNLTPVEKTEVAAGLTEVAFNLLGIIKIASGE